MPEMLAFRAETIFCALRHKKLTEGKKITAMTKAPPGLSIAEFSTAERAKLARLILAQNFCRWQKPPSAGGFIFPLHVCDAF
jgi:hypothetical protein